MKSPKPSKVPGTAAVLTVVISVFLLIASAFGQTPTPSPQTSETQRRLEEMQAEIELLKRQKELLEMKSQVSNLRLDEIRKSVQGLEKGQMPPSTQYNVNAFNSPESKALTYEAAYELAPRLAEAFGPQLSKYSGIVIYHDPEFRNLAKYRYFTAESAAALRNYTELVKILEAIRKADGQKAVILDDDRGRPVDGLTMALSLPSIGMSYASSVAGLLSVFRTETSFAESGERTLNDAAFGSLVADELRNRNSALKVFHPAGFVPEYELPAEGQDSLIKQIARLSEASIRLGEFLAQYAKLPANLKNRPGLNEAAILAELVSKQIEPLLAQVKGKAGENASEIPQLVRAEKLDRFLRGGNSSAEIAPTIGIMVLRSLDSGGTRKETRNMFFGNRITYSGMVIIEALIYDADGTLRGSKVFSHHTGFRKMKEIEKIP